MARRNPRNVPLDIFDTGPTEPTLYKDIDPSFLSRSERDELARVRTEYINSLEDTRHARESKASAEYRGIFIETIRGIGETLYRMNSKGLFSDSLNSERWTEFGKLFSSVLRDIAAADFTQQIIYDDLFYPQKTTQKWYWHKLLKKEAPEIYRKRFEDRVVLFEKWIQARCNFEARPEILASRALDPIGDPKSLTARVQRAMNLVTAIQAAHSAEKWNSLVLNFDLLRGAVVGILIDRGLSDIAKQYEFFAVAKIPELKSEASRAIKLAEKGEAKISKKEAAARENTGLAGRALAGSKRAWYVAAAVLALGVLAVGRKQGTQ